MSDKAHFYRKVVFADLKRIIENFTYDSYAAIELLYGVQFHHVVSLACTYARMKMDGQPPVISNRYVHHTFKNCFDWRTNDNYNINKIVRMNTFGLSVNECYSIDF